MADAELEHGVEPDAAAAGDGESDLVSEVAAVVVCEVPANVVCYGGGCVDAHVEAILGGAEAPTCDCGLGPDLDLTVLD